MGTAPKSQKCAVLVCVEIRRAQGARCKLLGEYARVVFVHGPNVVMDPVLRAFSTLAIQLSIYRNSAELTRLYPGVFKTPHSSSPIDSAGARWAVSKHG